MRFLALLPLPVLRHLGDGLYFLTYYVARWRLPLARRNLATAFPERSPAEREAILKRSYRHLAHTVMEAAWGFRADADEFRRRVRFENPEPVEAYKAAGTSLVLMTAHVCNWEWLLSASGIHFDFPIDAIYRRIRVEGVDRYMRDARSRFGGNPIPIDSLLYEVMRRAGQPRAYAMLADQSPKKNMPKHWTTFFGKPTAFYLGAEKIARFLDAPVLYVEMKRGEAPGYYSVRFHVLAEPPYEDDAGPLIAEAYARALERTIRAHPDDWLWSENKWRLAPPDAGAPGAGT